MNNKGRQPSSPLEASQPGREDPVTIRSYRETDRESVRSLFASSLMDFSEGFEEGMKAYIRHSLSDDLADISAQYVRPARSGFWIAEAAGSLKGMVGIQQKTEEAAELRRMSVSSDSRRRGIGRKLLETTESFCRDQGYRRIFLTTVTPLQPAIRMYREYGFRLVGEEQYGQITGLHFIKDLYPLDGPR